MVMAQKLSGKKIQFPLTQIWAMDARMPGLLRFAASNYNIAGGGGSTHQSINEARRADRELQMNRLRLRNHRLREIS